MGPTRTMWKKGIILGIRNSIISSLFPPDMEWRPCSNLPSGILTLLRFSFQQKSRLQMSHLPCCLQFLSQIESSNSFNFCLRLSPRISVSDWVLLHCRQFLSSQIVCLQLLSQIESSDFCLRLSNFLFLLSSIFVSSDWGLATLSSPWSDARHCQKLHSHPWHPQGKYPHIVTTKFQVILSADRQHELLKAKRLPLAPDRLTELSSCDAFTAGLCPLWCLQAGSSLYAWTGLGP